MLAATVDANFTSAKDSLNSKQTIALKLFKTGTYDHHNIAKREFDILHRVKDHPNIVEVYDFVQGNGQVEVPNCLPREIEDTFAQYRTGSTIEKDATYFTMELTKNGDFFDVIKATGGLKNLALTRFLFKQLCEGVKHIHSVGGYSHLDLKLDNILIGNDFKLKICDFGFAMDKATRIEKKYGTPSYMAPEIN